MDVDFAKTVTWRRSSAIRLRYRSSQVRGKRYAIDPSPARSVSVSSRGLKIERSNVCVTGSNPDPWSGAAPLPQRSEA